MGKDICREFEYKVLSQIEKLTEQKLKSGEEISLRLGVAVSGGADSISLLSALNSIFTGSKFPLFVITVNHFIRPAEETCGDAAYVEHFCDSLKKTGGNIVFKLVELKEGQVAKCAEERGEGIEEAARFLRYSVFEQFIIENNLDYLCLAHNKNDQEETLIMRFLQGSAVEASIGISPKRGKYIRPLIEIDRKDIERYLVEKDIGWRTDSTNLDTQYLRNKIRLDLIPFLNERFSGWQGAVLNGGKKALVDGKFINAEVEKAFCKVKNNTIQTKDFMEFPEAVQSRVLIRLFNEEGCSSRIPYVFVQDLIEEIKKEKNFSKQFCEYNFYSKDGNLFIKKINKTQTDLVLFDIIERNGVKSYPFGLLQVEKKEEGILLTCNEVSVLLDIEFPFCVRNLQIDDSIRCKDGNEKKVIDVYSDWKISEEKRMLIPLVQELKTGKQELKCIFGEPFGFYNWVVRK